MLTLDDLKILQQETNEAVGAVYEAQGELMVTAFNVNREVVSATTAASAEALMAVIESGIKLQREFCQLLKEEDPQIALEIISVKMEKFETEQTSAKRVVVA